MHAHIDSHLLDEARRDASCAEGLVTFLKRAGLSKAASVIAYAHVQGVAPAAAKRVVHGSATWAEQRARDEALHETLFKAAGPR